MFAWTFRMILAAIGFSLMGMALAILIIATCGLAIIPIGVALAGGFSNE